MSKSKNKNISRIYEIHQDALQDKKKYDAKSLKGFNFTFPEQIKKIAREKNACNAVIVKPNQIGTLSETIDFVKYAQKHNLKTIVSHRSGETCDDFIADLAIAINADYVKFGSLSRGERTAKWNRLMKIESGL